MFVLFWCARQYAQRCETCAVLFDFWICPVVCSTTWEALCNVCRSTEIACCPLSLKELGMFWCRDGGGPSMLPSTVPCRCSTQNEVYKHVEMRILVECASGCRSCSQHPASSCVDSANGNMEKEGCRVMTVISSSLLRMVISRDEICIFQSSVELSTSPSPVCLL